MYELLNNNMTLTDLDIFPIPRENDTNLLTSRLNKPLSTTLWNARRLLHYVEFISLAVSVARSESADSCARSRDIVNVERGRIGLERIEIMRDTDTINSTHLGITIHLS